MRKIFLLLFLLLSIGLPTHSMQKLADEIETVDLSQLPEKTRRYFSLGIRVFYRFGKIMYVSQEELAPLLGAYIFAPHHLGDSDKN